MLAIFAIIVTVRSAGADRLEISTPLAPSVTAAAQGVLFDGYITTSMQFGGLNEAVAHSFQYQRFIHHTLRAVVERCVEFQKEFARLDRERIPTLPGSRGRGRGGPALLNVTSMLRPCYALHADHS